MNKLERVQVGIRTCLKTLKESTCDECPYRDKNELCTDAMNRDALELVTMMASAWDMVAKTLADYHLSLEDAGKKKQAKVIKSFLEYMFILADDWKESIPRIPTKRM